VCLTFNPRTDRANVVSYNIPRVSLVPRLGANTRAPPLPSRGPTLNRLWISDRDGEKKALVICETAYYLHNIHTCSTTTRLPCKRFHICSALTWCVKGPHRISYTYHNIGLIRFHADRFFFFPMKIYKHSCISYACVTYVYCHDVGVPRMHSWFACRTVYKFIYTSVLKLPNEWV
jgi:hypothetical protein